MPLMITGELRCFENYHKLHLICDCIVDNVINYIVANNIGKFLVLR